MLKQKLSTFLCIISLFFPLSWASAETIISPFIYAWSSQVGYINFASTTVSDIALGGYAWSTNEGSIKLNPLQGGVLNDGAGNLSGFAWGEQLGWIDFGNTSINPDTGQFSGTATGALVGTITFDCPNYCDVRTDWRPISSPSPSSLPPSAPSGGGGGSGGRVVLLTDGTLAVNSNETATTTEPLIIALVTGNSGATPIPREGVLPLGVLLTENPALFDVISEPVQVRVAPGELLPITVKLSNFGGGQRVDVLITYSLIASQGEEIYSTNETVAVETTANFVKTIQILLGTQPGIYTARTSITYAGQIVPATTEFPFRVERKILGLYQSDFLLYGGITGIISMLTALFGYALIKSRRRARFSPFDYSNVSHAERTFYEILSDVIMEMRQRVGDDALLIAAHIEGLEIDKETGQVLSLTTSPAKIVATLVSEYEKVLGKKVSFSFRQS